MSHPTTRYLPAPFDGSVLGVHDGTRWYLAPYGTAWPGLTVRQYSDGARFVDPWPPDWAIWRTPTLGHCKVSFTAHPAHEPVTEDDYLTPLRFAPPVAHQMQLAPADTENTLLQVARLASARAARTGLIYHPPRFQIGAESLLADTRIHVHRAAWRLSADVTPGSTIDLEIHPDTGNIWQVLAAGEVHL